MGLRGLSLLLGTHCRRLPCSALDRWAENQWFCSADNGDTALAALGAGVSAAGQQQLGVAPPQRAGPFCVCFMFEKLSYERIVGSQKNPRDRWWGSCVRCGMGSAPWRGLYSVVWALFCHSGPPLTSFFAPTILCPSR